MTFMAEFLRGPRGLILFVGFFVLSAGALWPLSARAAQEPGLREAELKSAEGFIASVIEDGIDFLTDEALSPDMRRDRFRILLSKSFNMKLIGRFAMGRYWRQASVEQKKEYLKLFENYTIEVYAGRFDEYSGQKIEVRSVRAEGKADAVVSSFMISPNAPEVQVDWRVRLKDGRYTIVDVIVEGVSMALTQRSDFSSVIQRGGGKVDVLLVHLR